MAEAVECGALLERLSKESEAVCERATAQFSDLSEEQIRWRPPEGGWSIAECLDHLIVTDRGYLDNTDRALVGVPRSDPPPPFRPGRLATWFIGMLEPTSGRRFKAPGGFQPTSSGDALDRFLAVQNRLRTTLAALQGIDLTRTRVTSPVTRLIRFRLGDALRLVVVHDKRHVLQAERVRAHPDFPTPEPS